MVEFFDHQTRFIHRARSERRLALFADPGVGKTITILGILDERPMGTLVVAPRSVMEAAWVNDGRHFPGLDIRLYHGPRRASVLAEMTPSTVIVTTFETFRRDVERLAKHAVAGDIGRLVVDESSKVKNPKSGVTKAAIRFSDIVAEVYLLSGTPAPNGPEEYWPQLRMLDARPGGVADAPGVSGGRSPIFFRWAGHYLNAQRKRLGARVVTTGYTLREDRREAFNLSLGRVAERIRKDDCLDLPEKIEQVIPVTLRGEDGRAYLDLEANAKFDGVDGEIDVQAASLARKLHQTVGGNVRDAEGEWHAFDSSKLDTLGDIVESLGDEPFLVWTQYRVEATRVVEALDRLGVSVGRCDGATSRWIPETLREFERGNLRAIVGHPASIGHGVTLTRCGDRPCRTAVYFSLGYSWENHAQTMDRIHRAGQTERCLYYYLVGRDTIDEPILAALRSKADASRAVIDAIKTKRGIPVGGAA